MSGVIVLELQHTCGFAVFGQVTIASLVNAKLTIPTGSEISGYVGDTETFTPELASTLTTLFTTVFGRRLGTTTDGTTLNTTPVMLSRKYKWWWNIITIW